MVRPTLDGLVEPPLPQGYQWRTFREGDEDAWCEVVDGNIGEGWSSDKFELAIFTAPQFDPEGLFMATRDGRPAGTCCTWEDESGKGDRGILHMLAVRPEHRDRGLGTFLAYKVLEYFRNRGFSSVELSTDDSRLDAIKIYLNLGFTPEFRHENHPGRWAEVFVNLKLDPADYGHPELSLEESAGE
jgi:mycothiol synthase